MCMFRKQHYEAIAATMQESHPGAALSADNRAVIQWYETVKDLAEMLERDNPKFDTVHFVKACRPAILKIKVCLDAEDNVWLLNKT